jgi:hypothetical protein
MLSAELQLCAVHGFRFAQSCSSAAPVLEFGTCPVQMKIENHPPVSLEQLASLLTALGCPQQKSTEMAAQLDKRAKQLAKEKKRSYDDALTHLVGLMRQGWAAKEKGL